MRHKYLPYKKDDYYGQYNLLKAERNLMVKALMRSGGKITQAHKFLCPTNKPFCDYQTLLVKIERHGIFVDDYKRKNKPPKTRSEIEEPKRLKNPELQKKLRDWSEENGIKLRSVMN